MTLQARFFTAIATPLDADDRLYTEGLEKEITDQLDAGIDGLLVAGTMGSMQLLTDETYAGVVRQSIEFMKRRGEVFVGAGDASLGRTLRRIEFLNTLPIDGIVVLAPYLAAPTQSELIDYYTTLADFSRSPLYLYDIPQLTRTKLEFNTVVTLAAHPNVRGIKCSDDPSYMRQLIDELGDSFRVIMAASLLIDVFLRHGFNEHLDGIFCLCPRQVVAIGRAAASEDWQAAAQIQQGINRTMRLLGRYGIWPAFTTLMNALGTPGYFRPRPYGRWSPAEIESFLSDPETLEVIGFLSDKSTAPGRLIGEQRSAVHAGTRGGN